MIETLAQLISQATDRDPDAPAIRYKSASTSYAELAHAVDKVASGLAAIGIERNDRVAVFAGKQPDSVISLFATSLAGGVFVPINALFKAPQVTYILNNCNVRVLVTTQARYDDLATVLPNCPDLRHVVIIDNDSPAPAKSGPEVHRWKELCTSKTTARPRVIGSDMAAIMYTSGSTGHPKGVVLSHANMIIGAQSVAHYLDNSPEDRILAVLPLSFDAGLSQLTTGFCAGSCVILHDYLLARDVVRIVEREQVTGITGVPPLWMQLAEQDWPAGSTDSVRYFANTGGKMPGDTLTQLRRIFSKARPFLMYGLTESFRSTYLPPDEVDARPDSMGKAIPNVEVMVVSSDGELCAPGQVGELVHRGPLVSLGYWNDPERTAARFRAAPGQPAGLPNPELAVWSGDSVKMDDDGFLYFVGRIDDMIKTSGYRVSPAEVEEVAYDSGLVAEAAALGLPHPRLGQRIVLIVKSKSSDITPTEELLSHIRRQLPNYMVPAAVYWNDTLPRNANGKLDRRAMISWLESKEREDLA